MLQNPNWDRGTLHGLIHWLEGKPRDGTYNFSDCSTCLIRQYMEGVDFEFWPTEMRRIYHGSDEHKIARGTETFGFNQTYGAALERAHAAQAAVAAVYA